MAIMYCAEIRRISQAEAKAAMTPETVNGWISATAERRLSPRVVRFHAKTYQPKMPNDMKERNTMTTRGKIDSAVQMSKGRIGDLATLAS